MKQQDFGAIIDSVIDEMKQMIAEPEVYLNHRTWVLGTLENRTSARG